VSNEHGRVALVTGGSRGIGRATAIRLAQDHNVVAISYQSASDAAVAAAREIEAAGAEALVVQCDLASTNEAKRLIDTVVTQFDRIDSVVNNAGIAERHSFLDLDLESWQRSLDVNLSAPFVIIQGAAQTMIENGRGGAIVNVGSPAATNGGRTGAHYAASKAGLIGLTMHASKALGPHQIRVNLVNPLAIDTDMMRGAAVTPNFTPPSPLGRLGEPAEAAEVIAFLCSTGASFLTGISVDIDGGA